MWTGYQPLSKNGSPVIHWPSWSVHPEQMRTATFSKGCVMVCGCFISTVRWKIQPFSPVFPLAGATAKAFCRLSLWSLKEKTSTIFYNTAKHFVGYPLWNFKGKSVSLFLWHSLSKAMNKRFPRQGGFPRRIKPGRFDRLELGILRAWGARLLFFRPVLHNIFRTGKKWRAYRTNAHRFKERRYPLPFPLWRRHQRKPNGIGRRHTYILSVGIRPNPHWILAGYVIWNLRPCQGTWLCFISNMLKSIYFFSNFFHCLTYILHWSITLLCGEFSPAHQRTIDSPVSIWAGQRIFFPTTYAKFFGFVSKGFWWFVVGCLGYGAELVVLAIKFT